MKKLLTILSLILSVTIISCEKSNPITPTVSNAVLSDLVGNWSGSTTNSSNNITLLLTVDTVGNISGSGVKSKWSITNAGRVTGGGTYSFTAGYYSFIVADASWLLQLNSDKNTLAGTLDITYGTLRNMTVNLNKQ
jgi:hypothetical protein